VLQGGREVGGQSDAGGGRVGGIGRYKWQSGWGVRRCREGRDGGQGLVRGR
jgi:hypothetical protein